MYAIFSDGGRQYKVEPGQTVDVDYRDGAQTGETLEFSRVLAVNQDGQLKLGSPTVAGATVKATVVGLEKGEKIFIEKFNRRKNFRRRTGHRQMYTRIQIESINV